MYVYLYDNFVKKKKYFSVIKTIENRLTDFGINGKILRLQQFINPRKLVLDELKRGAKTVVIVGDDDTFSYVLTKVADLDVTFGFVPVGSSNNFANVLGIPVGENSCDVLSKRRVMHLDVGFVQNRDKYFIGKLEIPPSDIAVSYDGMFSASSETGLMELTVSNLIPFEWSMRMKTSEVKPYDNKLDAYLRPLVRQGIVRNKLEEPSIFQFNILEVVSVDDEPFSVMLDGQKSKEKHIVVTMADKKISMIVGKERAF